MGVAIRAKDLVKRYDSFQAVSGIDFEIHTGECFGFLGPNGAGKTTTMRMIYRAAQVTSGFLEVAGADATDPKNDRKIKRLIGVVPQEDNLDSELTLWETLMVFSRFYRLPKKEAEERAQDFLEQLDLAEKKHESIDKLSGGMKRRTLIARALMGEPSIVILDEPTTGLDPQARHRLWRLLRKMKAQGRTLVLTTHYMEEAAQLCDRLAIMDEGKIIAFGSPSELIKEHVAEEIAVGQEHAVTSGASPLEKVFLKLTKERVED